LCWRNGSMASCSLGSDPFPVAIDDEELVTMEFPRSQGMLSDILVALFIIIVMVLLVSEVE
jgi:hypothetical protein